MQGKKAILSFSFFKKYIYSNLDYVKKMLFLVHSKS